jgi:opacity protein-like surface antigen
MKKTLLPALILLLFFSSTALAQLPFKIGVRAGVNFANASYSPDLTSGIEKSGVTGFKFGALAELGFIPMFALQIEPMYVQGGSEISGPLFNNGFQLVNGKITSKITYLEIPILLKLKIPAPGISPYVFAGPNIMFLLSSKETDEPNGYPSEESDQKDFTSSTNFALDFGAGVGFDIAPLITLIIDARYSLGLSNVLNDKGKQLFNSDQSIKTTGIQIVTGVMFGL